VVGLIRGLDGFWGRVDEVLGGIDGEAEFALVAVDLEADAA